MLIIHFIFLLLILIFIAYIYEKQKDKYYSNPVNVHKEISSNLSKSQKPILWIHIPFEYNSRNWLSFGSRSSYDLNIPYLYLTTQSIIKNCSESFNIVIIDDNSFFKLIPNFNINMEILASPIKDYVRIMCMSKLLYLYGGMIVPISFLCFKDLYSLYIENIISNKVFIAENNNYPDVNFMGCSKGNETLNEFINYLQILISRDNSAESEFLNNINSWFYNKKNNQQINIISGIYVGTKTKDNNLVLVDDLMGQNTINFSSELYGIWIPTKELLSRRKYEYICRMSIEQISQGNFILAKYLSFVSSSLNSNNYGSNKDNILESYVNKADWISFWKVPLTNGTLNIWGPMPQNLGNNVPRAKNSGNLVKEQEDNINIPFNPMFKWSNIGEKGEYNVNNLYAT